jgi:hypothetical protein
MQIYLPFTKIKLNVSILNELDLLHQRAVALTVAETITGQGKGWQWHPGVTMWLDNEPLLGHIALALDEEWARRSQTDERMTPAGVRGLSKDYQLRINELGMAKLSAPPPMPWWWGVKRFHDGNQSELIRHEPNWYGQLFKKTPNDLCEWWPRKEQNKWVYGPQRGPNGDFAEYFINEVPIYQSVRKMSDHDFVTHANRFHNLTPDSKGGVSIKTPTLEVLRAMHDMFHNKRVYSTHDHRG